MNSYLSEKQEILLCRLFDKDLGLFKRLLALRLIRSNCAAREFYHSLESISSAVVGEPSEMLEGPISSDLWSRIDQRIDAEERAALFLGQRSSSHASVKPGWHSFFSTQALLGGLSGAVTTAMVLLVVSSMRSGANSQVANSVLGGQNNSSLFTQASHSNGFENSYAPAYSSGSSHTRPLIMNPARNNSVMEVDWMRGDGPLRVIQNPSERSTIIWVKRKNQARSSQRSPNNTLSKPRIILTHAPMTSSNSSSLDR